MFGFEILSKLGIVLSLVYLSNVLVDLTDSKDQLLDSAVQIESSNNAMISHTSQLLSILDTDPELIYKSGVLNGFNNEKLEKEKEVFSKQSKDYILSSAETIEKEILSEDTAYTVEEVNTTIKELFEVANNS